MRLVNPGQNEQRTRELSVLHDTALAGTKATDRDDLLRRVTEILTADLYPENVGFLLLDDSGEVLTVHPSYHGIPEEMYKLRVKVDTGVTGSVVQTGKPRLIDDVSTVPEYVEGMPGVRSELCVPVRAGGEIIGVINVESAEKAAFSKRDLRLVSAVATYVSTVLDKLKFIEEARRRASELEALRRTGLDLMSQLELSSLLRGIVRRATELLQASGGALHLYHPDRDDVEVAVSHNLGRDYTGTRVEAGVGLAGQIAATGKPLIINDYEHWEDKAPVYEGTQFGAAIGVPLNWQDRVVGVINLVNGSGRRPFNEHDLDLLEAFAQQASVAIENARLYRAAEKRAAELETLHRVSLTLSASLELSDVLDAILAGTFQLLPDADDAHIFLYQDEELKFGAARWADGRQETPWATPRPDGLTYTVARSGKPLVVPDMRNHSLFANAPVTWKGAIVGVPLKIGERVVGVMNVAFLESRMFSETELRLLSLLGDRAAIAIENARLFAAEQASRRRAETLQGVAAALGATLEVEELLHRVLEELQKVVPYNSASIQLLRDDSLEIIAGRGFEDPEEVIGRVYPIRPNTPDERILETKQPVLLSDTHAENPDFMTEPYEYIRSWLGAPLLYKGNVIGMITLDRTKVDAFSKEETRVAMAFANHVAVALENARLYEKAQHQAVTDGLTRLYNSRYFYKCLNEELGRSRRYSHHCSLIMIDLDDFKQYNDRYGHLAGDDLLRELAGVMKEHVRETDTVARYGGEEFVVILPETTATDAHQLADRLRLTVCAHEFVVRDAQQVGRITISAGVAAYPTHAAGVEELVQAADMALLQAKETKDRVCVAEETGAGDDSPQ